MTVVWKCGIDLSVCWDEVVENRVAVSMLSSLVFGAFVSMQVPTF